MTIPLNIKALCFTLGNCESETAASLIVSWKGKAFTDPKEAIGSFITASLQAATQPAHVRAPCCEATWKRNPAAKACETCGHRKKDEHRKEKDLDDYLAGLMEGQMDGFIEKSHPFDPDRDCGDDHEIGGWWFFRGFPVNCDVVVVNGLDGPYKEHGRTKMDYHVVHVGKQATRAMSHGSTYGLAR